MMEDSFMDNRIDEPDDIERVIEDGDEGRRDSGSDEEKKKDEEEKEKEKTKNRKKNSPRVVLDARRLIGPRGLGALKGYFKGVKLDSRRGKEQEGIDMLMSRFELWAHRLYPRGRFEDTLKKVTKLTSHRLVKNYIERVKMGLEPPREPEPQRELEDPRSPPPGDPSALLLTSEQSTNTEQTVEEKRAARIKKAKELRNKFLAQRKLNSRKIDLTKVKMEVEDKNVKSYVAPEKPESPSCSDSPDDRILMPPPQNMNTERTNEGKRTALTKKTKESRNKFIAQQNRNGRIVFVR